LCGLYSRVAAERGIRIAAVNLGRTRADPLLDLKLEVRCEDALDVLADALPKGSVQSRP
jgi:NAD-dependent SIR2 family protein deacetylase